MSWSLPVSNNTDLEPSPCFSTPYVSGSDVRKIRALLGASPGSEESIFRDLFLTKPGGVAINVPSAGPKSLWFHLEDFSVGLQQGRRGLFDRLENPLCTSGLETQHARDRYLPGNSGVCQKRHLFAQKSRSLERTA